MHVLEAGREVRWEGKTIYSHNLCSLDSKEKIPINLVQLNVRG